MALLSGSDTIDTAFTPATGVFRIQVSGGTARLQSRATSGSPWVYVHDKNNGIDFGNVALYVRNDVAGAQYRFTDATLAAVFRADQ